MGLPVTSAVFLIANKFWYNVGVSEEYLRYLCYPLRGYNESSMYKWSIQSLSGRDRSLAIRPPIVHLLLYVKCVYHKEFIYLLCTVLNLELSHLRPLRYIFQIINVNSQKMLIHYVNSQITSA
jgi:hypothetical protein